MELWSHKDDKSFMHHLKHSHPQLSCKHRVTTNNQTWRAGGRAGVMIGSEAAELQQQGRKVRKRCSRSSSARSPSVELSGDIQPPSLMNYSESNYTPPEERKTRHHHLNGKHERLGWTSGDTRHDGLIHVIIFPWKGRTWVFVSKNNIPFIQMQKGFCSSI